MERVLLTGATGRLGRQVAWDLAAAGYVVTAAVRDPTRVHAPAFDGAPSVRVRGCDLANPDAVGRLADLAGDGLVLVHLASGPPAEASDHAACTRQVVASINLIATFGPLLALAVIGSCTSVYGATGSLAWVDASLRTTTGTSPEDDHRTRPTTYHGASQLASERFWSLFARNSGKPVARLRFSPFAGAADVRRASAAVLATLQAGEGGLFHA